MRGQPSRPELASPMFPKLLMHLYGAFVVLLLALNVILCFIPIFILAIIKLLTPVQAWRDGLSNWLVWFGEHWISINRAILGLTQNIEWDIRGREGLERKGSYLMISNHQSWVDILALQLVFNRRIPFLKFFIKDVLKWVPFLGVAWWAMDMPFMKRYSRAYLEKHPEKRGEDLAATRRACEKFRSIPTTVINFVEGTRVTPEKQRARQSVYAHLMPPRAGGVAFVLDAMGDALHSLIDVTIVYPDGNCTFWDLCCRRLRRIVIDIRTYEIEPWLLGGDYQNDPEFRSRFQTWLTELWHEKDARMTSLLALPAATHPGL
jgi:1-acyl-sn-glycerol-3-phosphate acyltransferase